MTISAPCERVVSIVADLIFLGFPGYLEYRAIQELRGQLAKTKRTGRVSGHVLLAAGLVLFFGLLMLLVVISLLGIRNWSWASPFMIIAMGLLFLGMFLGNQQIGRLRKRRLARTGTNDPPSN